MKNVIYRSAQVLDCQCDTDVIICLPATLTVANVPFIQGTLTTTQATSMSSCGSQIYSYYLTYNEGQFLDPTHNLLASEITGIICKDCLTSWVEALNSSTTCYSCENANICVHPFIYPECYGAIGDGVRDDSASINAAIDAARLAGGGTILFSSGKNYKVESSVLIPITASNITLSGYGAGLVGDLDDTILKISDITTPAIHSSNINVVGLSIYGSGYTDLTHPNQNGVEINAIIGCAFRDVQIWNIPGTGLIGRKSPVSGYWNKVVLDNVSIRFIGHQGISVGEIGYNSAGDDLVMNNCIINHCGEQISSNFAAGAAYLKVISLAMIGCEISGNYSISHAGFGYRWGLQIRVASGALIGNHYEGNGNNQAGSADLLLDSDAHGLHVVGSDHFGSLAQAPKYCIQTTSRGNRFDGIKWCGDVGIHNYDYVINANTAKDVQVGNIQNFNNPQIAPNVAVVNIDPSSFGSGNLVAHDNYVSTGRRNERYQTRYASANPAQIVINGWGATATVTSVRAYDSHGDFTISASGGGQTNPATIEITFADGDWPSEPTCIMYQRTTGGGGTLSVPQVAVSAHRILFTANSAPVNNTTYTFTWQCIGME